MCPIRPQHYKPDTGKSEVGLISIYESLGYRTFRCELVKALSRPTSTDR